MVQPRYDKVRLVVGESNPDLSFLKGALTSRGMRNVITCRGSDRMSEALGENLVDLLLYDYDLPGGDFVEVMQSIRRKAVGRNPFVIVIATVRDSAQETVRRLINSGIDDLIRKPMSIDRLFESIGKFTQTRKPFAVSYDYVGPTRRSAQRREEKPNELIQVPNTLRSRVVKGIGDSELQRLVDIAVMDLETKQLESCGTEIDILARRVAQSYEGAGAESEVFANLRRLMVVGEDLYRRSNGTSSQQVARLATMLVALIHRILQYPAGHAKIEITLLGKLAAAIRRALSVEQTSIDVMKEIADTIAGFTLKH